MIKKLANIILVGILVICIYQMSIKKIEYTQDLNTYQHIQEIAASVQVENKEGLTDTKKETLTDKMKSLNSDYQAWIRIENTTINYPVVQTTDNDFYLKHDFNKSPSISGAIYLDYRNKLDDENLIIYGHNMRNQTMFEPLEQYKKQAFFEQNNKIYITLEDVTRVYEVFSVYVTKPNDDSLVPQFSSEEQYTTFLNKIVDLSLFSAKTDLLSEDKILTLYTCSYETKNSRTIIHAKLIEEEVAPQ